MATIKWQLCPLFAAVFILNIKNDLPFTHQLHNTSRFRNLKRKFVVTIMLCHREIEIAWRGDVGLKVNPIKITMGKYFNASIARNKSFALAEITVPYVSNGLPIFVVKHIFGSASSI